MTQTAQDFTQSLREHLAAGYQCLMIHTAEEARATAAIARLANDDHYVVIRWDVVNGFDCLQRKTAIKYRDPKVALFALTGESYSADVPALADLPERVLFVFHDLDDYFNDPQVRRQLRNLCEAQLLVRQNVRRPLLITSPKADVPYTIRSNITVIDFPLPDEEDIRDHIRSVKVVNSNGEDVSCPAEMEDSIVGSLLGLTSFEAENAFARSLAHCRGFVPELIPNILDEKARIVKKSEVLTYIPENHQAKAEEIGGYENLLEFVGRRALAYTKQAAAAGLDYPKGVVLLGPPGTGKSMVARAIARLLRLPGYFFDVSAVFGSLVGESESRMRNAIKLVEAQKGSVLVLDEADKAFGGAMDGHGDSGVTKRVFGQLLTWLAEKNDRTFVVMTLNRTKGLPPEFLRAGRFDKVFYTDLPSDAERRQILEIHLRKRHVDPAACGLSEEAWEIILERTRGFVGAELEEIVREARYMAFEKRGSGVPTFDELLMAIASIVPMSKMDEENVEAIREFCKHRATPVSRQMFHDKAPEKKARRRSIDITSN